MIAASIDSGDVSGSTIATIVPAPNAAKYAPLPIAAERAKRGAMKAMAMTMGHESTHTVKSRRSGVRASGTATMKPSASTSANPNPAAATPVAASIGARRARSNRASASGRGDAGVDATIGASASTAAVPTGTEDGAADATFGDAAIEA